MNEFHILIGAFVVLAGALPAMAVLLWREVVAILTDALDSCANEIR